MAPPPFTDMDQSYQWKETSRAPISPTPRPGATTVPFSFMLVYRFDWILEIFLHRLYLYILLIFRHPSLNSSSGEPPPSPLLYVPRPSAGTITTSGQRSSFASKTSWKVIYIAYAFMYVYVCVGFFFKGIYKYIFERIRR